MRSIPDLRIVIAVLSAASLAPSLLAVDTPVRWGTQALRQNSPWYASAEARAMADSVLRHQAPYGGWTKNTNLAVPPEPGSTSGNSTIDNNGTTQPIHYLALMFQATSELRYGAAVERGLDYLLAAQYPNGGWPQYFPLRRGYYSHITFNDGAMVNVLTLLRDVAASEQPYAFVDNTRRTRAAEAVERGIVCILRTQLRQDGRLTAWCAQYDENTFEPAWARAYEPPSLSGSESVGIVRFLMGIEQPSPQVMAAIEGAVDWFRTVAIPGIRMEDFTNPEGRRDRRIVADPAAEPMWARFYELGTNRPIFLGRDGVVRYSISEIEHERRNGYSFYGTWPESLINTNYPRWRAKHNRP